MLKRSVPILAVLICVLLLVPACAGPQGPAGPPGPPGSAATATSPKVASIVLLPPSGKEATPLNVIGAGFVPGEEIKVELVIKDASMLIGYTEKVGADMKQKHVADNFGNFQAISAYPTAAVGPPGVYAIKVTGDKGSTAVAPILVTK